MKNRISGIYLITERETGRGYVGQSIDIEGRWREHKSSRGKFPEDRFDYRIVIKADTCFLDALEQLYIEQFKTLWTEGGFNQNKGGQFWRRPEEPLSQETKNKLSQALKGKPSSNRGKSKSEQHIKNMSEALKGRVCPLKGKSHTEEAKKKMSEARKAYLNRKKLSVQTEQAQ